MRQSSLNARRAMTMCGLVLGIAISFQSSVKAEFDARNLADWSLWRTGNSCGPACPGIEAHTNAKLYVNTLASATGNVTIRVIPFADLSDNTDGGNGFGYYDLYIGGTRMTSGVSGHVSGAPSDGKFRKTNGTRPYNCCYHEGNETTIVVTDAFFNARLGAAGAASDELLVEIHIPSGSNVPCAAVANGCANMDDGTHRTEITWTPREGCWTNADCDDGLYCTIDTCNRGNRRVLASVQELQ